MNRVGVRVRIRVRLFISINRKRVWVESRSLKNLVSELLFIVSQL